MTVVYGLAVEVRDGAGMIHGFDALGDIGESGFCSCERHVSRSLMLIFKSDLLPIRTQLKGGSGKLRKRSP
jgi:hypothetical protein